MSEKNLVTVCDKATSLKRWKVKRSHFIFCTVFYLNVSEVFFPESLFQSF